MSTFNIIKDIFYSGVQSFRGANDSISEIAFLVEENYLSFSIVAIASKKEYKALLNNSDKLKRSYEAAGGGNAHIALKILTSEYVRKNRGCENVFEHPFCGYYPDVLSSEEDIVAECGHTDNSEKILTYFRQGNVKECIQVPYPSEEDEEVKGYSFTAKDNLKEFLVFIEEERRNKLKTLFLGKGKK